MKITLLLVTLCLAISLGHAAHRRQHKGPPVLINRPIFDEFGTFGRSRAVRSAWAGVKGGNHRPSPPSPLELRVRKGEYVCGNRLCKLKPGEVPKGCNGVCQYPV